MDASHAFHLERNQGPVLGILRATRTVQADRRTELEFGWKFESAPEGRTAEDHAAEDTAGLIEQMPFTKDRKKTVHHLPPTYSRCEVNDKRVPHHHFDYLEYKFWTNALLAELFSILSESTVIH